MSLIELLKADRYKIKSAKSKKYMKKMLFGINSSEFRKVRIHIEILEDVYNKNMNIIFKFQHVIHNSTILMYVKNIVHS